MNITIGGSLAAARQGSIRGTIRDTYRFRRSKEGAAAHAGHTRPDAMQRLLYRARWDADAVRDDLRQVIVDRFGDPDAVLVVDETRGTKKGTHLVGVQRQYTATAGRIENAQAGVFLSSASRHGHTLIDRRVYLSASWTDQGPESYRAERPSSPRLGLISAPLVAVGHSILIAAWHMITNDANYTDLAASYFLTRTDPDRQARRLVGQLHQLGFQVTLNPAG